MNPPTPYEPARSPRRAAFAGLALVALVAAGRLFVYSDDTTTHESADMSATKVAPARAGIPPIDAAAPAVTETATFALG